MTPTVSGPETRAFLSLVRTQTTRTNKDFYIVVGEAVADREFGSRQVGDHYRVVVGYERGMTDNGQPCWTSFGATSFDSQEDAAREAKTALNYGFYGGVLVPSSVEVKRVVTRKIEYYDEYTIEDAEDAIRKNEAGFREYMTNR